MAHRIPRERQDAITVVTCADGAFFAAAGVLFRSILDHADPGRHYDLICLHDGVEDGLLHQLCTMAEENVSIRTWDIRPVFSGEGLHTENRPGLSAMTYARLMIPEILGEEYRRAVYLDADMIVFRDVAALYDSDLQGRPLGATVDFGFLADRDPAHRRYARQVLGIEDPEDYCMAAVLVMDLEKLRGQKLLETAKSRVWLWHDQDVINSRFRGEIFRLDPAWDAIDPEAPLPEAWREIHRRAVEAPYIFHFAGSHGKPWENFRSPYGAEFWEIARRTPFYDRLMTVLREQKGTYERLYSPPKKAAFLRKLLPPPAESCQRDLKNILDAVDEQTRQYLYLLRRLHKKTAPGKPGEDTPLPLDPICPDGVTVVCCGDEGYAAPTAVLFQTIIDHADKKRQYELIYLHNGLSQAVRAGLLGLGGGNISVRTCDIRPLLPGNGLYTENRRNFSPMAYARLLIPHALRHPRALYLDGDMVACRDVGELFNADLKGKALGSTTDLYYAATRDAQYRRHVKKELGITRREDYIISGMLLMDLEKMRKAEDLMALAQTRKWHWHDQSVINYAFRGKIQLLDARWDSWDIGEAAALLPEEMKPVYRLTQSQPYIYHFAGGGNKPWERTFPKGSELFWKAARKTAFYPTLLCRLHRNLATYRSTHDTEGATMLKRFLKKILPPPVNSVQRDLKTVLDALDEQKQLGFLLMEQLDEKNGAVDKIPNRLLQFEFSLASHCNLNCAGCSHFSPLAEEEFPDFEESERDFARLGELFGGRCKYIHLMGGEPLLNPRCADYAVMARRHFPEGEIQIVTNGLLLPKMPDSFYRACRENRITICVTPYPIKLDYDAIRRRCENDGVVFQFYMHEQPKQEFHKLALDIRGQQDARENFRSCWYSNQCLFLRRGRMYPCGIGAHLGIFEERFHAGLELTDADSVDIYAVESPRELLSRLAKAPPMCRYCRLDSRETKTPWRRSEKDRAEWL